MTGADGFAMPATQHDALLWLAGSTYDVVFATAREAITALAPVAGLAEAPAIALVPVGQPGAGGSVLLLQRRRHDVTAWETLSTSEPERAMGRTKPDSVELDPRPETSHVARTDQDAFGAIFRRNMPYGTVTDHGTMFVGFAASQAPLQRMLESMAGHDGPRDAITHYAEPLTGAYYFVPSVAALATFGQP